MAFHKYLTVRARRPARATARRTDTRRKSEAASLADGQPDIFVLPPRGSRTAKEGAMGKSALTLFDRYLNHRIGKHGSTAQPDLTRFSAGEKPSARARANSRGVREIENGNSRVA